MMHDQRAGGLGARDKLSRNGADVTLKAALDNADAYLAVTGLIAAGMAAAHVSMASAERAAALVSPVARLMLAPIAGS